MNKTLKKALPLIASVAVGAVAFGAPSVRQGSVTMTQPKAYRVVINYTIDEEPAIVTVDIRTNGVSIGGANLWNFAGDVNKVVGIGAHSITWTPDKAWEGMRIPSGVTAVVTAWATNTPPDYMVVSLTAQNTRRFYANEESIPFGVTNDIYKTENLVMRKIPAKNVEWRMGSPSTETSRTAARETPHLVTLSEDFYIGVYQMTQRQSELITGSRLTCYYTNNIYYATRPVEKRSYDSLRGPASEGYDWPTDGHAVKSGSFIDKLRTHSGIDTFDLPLEAQWEFACRAGCGSALYSGKEVSAENVNELGRYSDNGGKPGGVKPDQNCTTEYGTSTVGSYKKNAWGLYDMMGNVAEWCLDWWQESPLGYDVETGPISGTKRVMRGGCWYYGTSRCRSAYRTAENTNNGDIDFGFRIACAAGVSE